MHLHYPEPHLLPSRASSSRSERGEKKKSSSTRSSSASTHSGESTATSSSTASSSHHSSNSTSTSTTRKSHRRKSNEGDASLITSKSPRVSTASSSSSASYPNTPVKSKQDNQVLRALRQVAGDRVRHSKCPPEYLEGIAHRSDQHVEIMSGNEASTFFVRYLGGHGQNDASSTRSNKSHGGAQSQAIVFAVTVWDYDKKIVDYYMTWREKTAANGLKEQEVKVLDEEFRRVSRRIDKDYKQFRRAGSVSSGTSHRSHHSSRSKRDRSRSPSSPRKSRPPSIKLPPPGADLPTPPASGGTSPEPPVSATSSVISLPYLTMVRGVPRGNRMPLTVTNPDRLSMLSEIDLLVEDPEATAKPNLSAWREEEAETPVIDVTPPDTKTPSHLNDHPSDPSGLTPLMKSSASVYSTETQSSASSRSSNGDGRDPEDLSDLTHKFLIVNLGDKVPREGLSWHGLERNGSVLAQDRANHHKERSSPWMGPLAKGDHNSGLQVPLPGQPLRSISDGSCDDDGHWNEAPVVPLKPLLETLGYVPHGHANSDPNTPASSYPHTPFPPVIPPGYPGSYGGSVGAPSPAAPHAMHLGGYGGAAGMTPRASMVGNGSYVPGWVSQTHSTNGSPLSRSASRSLPPPVAYTASPYMHPGY